MTHTPNDAPSRLASYLQAYRRHRLLCWTPIVLGAVAAVLILIAATTTYRSTASLWVDTSSGVPSSIGASGNASLTEPPATSEQGILAELLTTKAFADSVVSNSVVGHRLGARATAGSASFSLLKDVKSSVAGEQILNLTYTASSGAVAQSVLGSVLNQLQAYNDTLANQHAQASVTFDREQVKLDETALQTATGNVRAFLNQHPNASKTNPVYISLTSTESDAVTALGQATTTLNNATASTGGGSGWVIRVLDPASGGVSRAPDKKRIVAVIIGGAFGGLLVCLLALVALVPARRKPEPESDDRAAAERVPVPASTDELESATRATASEPADELARLLASLGSNDDEDADAPPADPFIDDPVDDGAFPWERLTAPSSAPDRDRLFAGSARRSGSARTEAPARSSARTQATSASKPRSPRATKSEAAKPEATKPAETTRTAETTKTDAAKSKRAKTR